MKRFQKLNAFVGERFRIFLKQKYSDRSRGKRKVHDSLLVHWVCTSSVDVRYFKADKLMEKVVGEPYRAKPDVRFDEGA